MIPTDNLLYRAKMDVYHRLIGDEALLSVPVLIDDEGSQTRREEVDLGPGNYRAGKTGACVVVAAVGVLQLESAQTPTPLMSVAVEFEVVEDVLINSGADGTGLTAGEIVARVVQTLHMSHYDDRFSGLRLAETAGVRELLSDRPGMRGFALRFVAGGSAFRVVPSCASVSASVVAGIATLTCPTTGAAIYYTLDGGYPGSGNEEATLYTVPFAVDSGASIRSAAQKTDLNPSKIILVYDV